MILLCCLIFVWSLGLCKPAYGKQEWAGWGLVAVGISEGWCVTGDMWHVTQDMWLVTCHTRRVTCNKWQKNRFFSVFQFYYYPKDPQIVPYPLATLKCSHALTSWTCADFLKLNNSLGQVVIQSKKSLHKFNLFMCPSISKLPRGMALFVGL